MLATSKENDTRHGKYNAALKKRSTGRGGNNMIVEELRP